MTGKRLSDDCTVIAGSDACHQNQLYWMAMIIAPEPLPLGAHEHFRAGALWPPWLSVP